MYNRSSVAYYTTSPIRTFLKQFCGFFFGEFLPEISGVRAFFELGDVLRPQRFHDLQFTTCKRGRIITLMNDIKMSLVSSLISTMPGLMHSQTR